MGVTRNRQHYYHLGNQGPIDVPSGYHSWELQVGTSFLLPSCQSKSVCFQRIAESVAELQPSHGIAASCCTLALQVCHLSISSADTSFWKVLIMGYMVCFRHDSWFAILRSLFARIAACTLGHSWKLLDLWVTIFSGLKI